MTGPWVTTELHEDGVVTLCRSGPGFVASCRAFRRDDGTLKMIAGTLAFSAA